MVKLSIFYPKGVSVRVPIGQLSEHIAKGSSAEVRSMYRIAESLGFVSHEIAQTRCGQCESISKQIGGFTKYLRK